MVCVCLCVCVCVHVYVFSSIIYEEREIYVLEVGKGIEFVYIGEGGQGESLERDLQYVVYLYIIFVL